MPPVELESLLDRLVTYRVATRKVLGDNPTAWLVFLCDVLILANYRNRGRAELGIVEDEGGLCGSLSFERDCRELNILSRRLEDKGVDPAAVVELASLY